jgi:hypothetical protein
MRPEIDLDLLRSNDSVKENFDKFGAVLNTMYCYGSFPNNLEDHLNSLLILVDAYEKIDARFDKELFLRHSLGVLPGTTREDK